MITNDLIATVNNDDVITGYSYKQEVHRLGLLHRAFSIQVIHSEKGFLLHQRAFKKYHSPGLWTNTCCSHLLPGEEMEEAIHKRLKHEMGFDCELNFVGKFRYYAAFDNGLFENEIDHVYVGVWDGTPKPHPDEVAEYAWVMPDDIKQRLHTNAHDFTAWFGQVFNTIRSHCR